MKIPLSWLKEYIDLPFTAEKIGETLTLAGLEVDYIDHLLPPFSHVVVAQVVTADPHPKADRLKVATVFDGEQTWQVVCGGANCRPGIKVALAKIGAQVKDLVIKSTKIRDVDSFGMLCGWDELGLEGDAEGIAELFDDMVLGTDLASLYSDVVFTISLTPNLGHALSVYGVARELSAFLQTPLRSWEKKPKEEGSSTIEKAIQVSIDNVSLCPVYSCRIVDSLSPTASPFWLVRKLQLSGLRSVSHVVDIANYVMLLTGQPLHFFDYEEIEGKKIFVGRCAENTKIETLDGIERKLPSGSVVIKDEKKILAIAGIMGAHRGAVTDTTKAVLIEAAVFNASAIQKTSRLLSCKTDASMRFERGVDSLAVTEALDLAASLLSTGCQGRVMPGILNAHTTSFIPKQIRCRIKKVNELLGTILSIGEVSDLLQRLDMTILEETPDFLLVAPPSYRNDISIEVDLIEEVARLYGFENLPKSRALHASSSLLDAPIFTLENKARSLLLKEGLQEFLTCDLMSPALAKIGLGHQEKDYSPLSVMQSKSNDYSTLRPTLLPGLLQLVRYNIDHQNLDVLGFEVGRIHFQEGKEFHERAHAGIVLSGHTTPYHHDPKLRKVDFFDLKGIVENLLSSFGVTEISFEPSHLANFQPGKQARIFGNKTLIGVLGEIHPSLREQLDIGQRVFFAEVDLQNLCELQKQHIVVENPALMPCSERDWTLTIAKHMPVAEVLSCIHNIPSPFLEKVFLLDVFENEKIGLDKKNITLRFIYRAKDKTLDFETVEQEQTKLIQQVAEKLGNCIL